jgi:hypothetical protein
MPMRKPSSGPIIPVLLVALAALAAASDEALAVKAGGAGTSSDGACMEQFHECQRGCGPSPSTANPACLKYCEEQVLAKCKAGGGGGAAMKGKVPKATVTDGVKSKAP